MCFEIVRRLALITDDVRLGLGGHCSLKITCIADETAHNVGCNLKSPIRVQ